MKSKPFKIAQTIVAPGESRSLKISLSKMYDFTDLDLNLRVVRGKIDGPRLFVSAAIHGDEIIGTEIVRRLLARPELKRLEGTLVTVPIVNVFGFNNKSRYLPDRRDLNRCFPGKKDGPLASQLAHIFMKEIVSKCTHGIDLHSAARDRKNLPQIRACLDDRETRRLALAFGTPVIIDSKLRDGSLREAARSKKIPMLLYEAGEALRIDEKMVRIGVDGCLSVMRCIGMLPGEANKNHKSSIAKGSYWIRAPHSGTVSTSKKLGSVVQKGQVIATLSNPLGSERIKVISNQDGIVIGRSELPLMNRGDAMFHIATSDYLPRLAESPLIDDSDVFDS